MVCPRCGAGMTAAAPCPRCGTSNDATVAMTVPPRVSADAEMATVPPVRRSPKAMPAGQAAPARDSSVTGFAQTPPPEGEDAATAFVPRPDAGTDAGIPDASALPPGSKNGPLTSGQSFGRRYHIIRALGVGGMGAVYQAWDAELSVAVAIKVIRPDVMADPTAA